MGSKVAVIINDPKTAKPKPLNRAGRRAYQKAIRKAIKKARKEQTDGKK